MKSHAGKKQLPTPGLSRSVRGGSLIERARKGEEDLMVEMELNKIVINEKRHDQLIVLKEKNGSRLLPIVIGLTEASAIKMKIGGFNPPRPLTHDLLYATIKNLGAKLTKVIIDRLEDNTFFAKLVIESGSGSVTMIDARPSDSIALAVRADVAIFVDESVLKQTTVFGK
ncbi:MAG: bifunctional nuclease family protein [Candidatus Omnitrophota bacterium]